MQTITGSAQLRNAVRDLKKNGRQAKMKSLSTQEQQALARVAHPAGQTDKEPVQSWY